MEKISIDDLMYIVEVSRIALENKSIRAEIQYQLSVDNDEMERIFQLVEIHDDSFEKDIWSNTPYQDKEFIENIYEIAFGDDAINRNFSHDEVIEQISEFSDNALLSEEFMNTLDMEDEEDYCLYERLTQFKENQ